MGETVENMASPMPTIILVIRKTPYVLVKEPLNVAKLQNATPSAMMSLFVYLFIFIELLLGQVKIYRLSVVYLREKRSPR